MGMSVNPEATTRVSRSHIEHVTSQHRATDIAVADRTETLIAESLSDSRYPGDAGEFRIDLERIRFSAYFARLAAVTQVVPQSGVGPVMHNRLTHSLKVSAVARVIAAELAARAAAHRAFTRGERDRDDATGAVIERLGGCDTVIAQAASHAHDLGHPPFGHLGERALDRVARTQLGLPEGFEGNAQSFRILTRLDTLGRQFPGLNLTAAARAATLKYPWTRSRWPGAETADTPETERPRGVGNDPHTGAEKFSAYAADAPEMEAALAAFPAIAPGMQTVECAVMDLADDIAYAVHDLDDFARAGVLQHAEVTGELGAWLRERDRFANDAPEKFTRPSRRQGVGLERLWRRMQRKDAWIADREAFTEAVRLVLEEIESSLLAVPFDGGIESLRAVSGFTRRWIERLRSSIVVQETPHVRSAPVRLGVAAWHEVAVLKFIHQYFVLERPELGQSQRGMSKVVEELALGFDAWLGDPDDRGGRPDACSNG